MATIKRVKPIIDKNAPGMDSPIWNDTKKYPGNPAKKAKVGKKLSPKKADKQSKPIQRGRAARLKRVSVKKTKKY